MPKKTENEIDALILKSRNYVKELPKKNKSEFNYSELETKKLYSRAYEVWTDKEIRLLKRAYEVFERVDKIAELLKRQPSAVQKKLDSI